MLRFDPRSHRYWLDDVEVLSVTTALRVAGFIDPRWYTEFARQRGSYVHQAIDWLNKGTLDEDALDPVIRPYVDAYRETMAAHKARCTRSEQQLADPVRMVAGTVDWVGWIDDAPAIVDYKSGQPEVWHRYQIAAYHGLVVAGGLPDTIKPHEIRRYGLYLRSNGAADLHRYPDRSDLLYWPSILTTAQLKVQHGLWSFERDAAA